MASHNELGTKGEDIAARFLEVAGYTILERNWRSGHSEIDIVARKEDLLIIIEVKTRSGTSFGDPEDAVTDKKIRRIVSAADAYLRHSNLELPVRFDIITIIDNNGHIDIRHIEEAFFPPIWN